MPQVVVFVLWWPRCASKLETRRLAFGYRWKPSFAPANAIWSFWKRTADRSPPWKSSLAPKSRLAWKWGGAWKRAKPSWLPVNSCLNPRPACPGCCENWNRLRRQEANHDCATDSLVHHQPTADIAGCPVHDGLGGQCDATDSTGRATGSVGCAGDHPYQLSRPSPANCGKPGHLSSGHHHAVSTGCQDRARFFLLR